MWRKTGKEILPPCTHPSGVAMLLHSGVPNFRNPLTRGAHMPPIAVVRGIAAEFCTPPAPRDLNEKHGFGTCLISFFQSMIMCAVHGGTIAPLSVRPPQAAAGGCFARSGRVWQLAPPHRPVFFSLSPFEEPGWLVLRGVVPGISLALVLTEKFVSPPHTHTRSAFLQIMWTPTTRSHPPTLLAATLLFRLFPTSGPLFCVAFENGFVRTARSLVGNPPPASIPPRTSPVVTWILSR